MSARDRNQLRLAACNGTADPLFQREKVALLIHEVERAIGSGMLPIEIEMRLRERVVMAGAAFGMPSIAERPTDPYEFNQALISREMEQPQ